jgi:tetratricopeptide (TPR) repeat protein
MNMTALPKLLWYQWLEWPIRFVKQTLNIDLASGWQPTIVKIALIILIVLVLMEVLLRVKGLILRLFRKEDWLEVDDVVLPDKGDTQFADSIEAAGHFEKTIAPLKKAKEYDRLGAVYASLNKHKDAAKWFAKAGDRKRAAGEWALAGRTLKAAKLLMKEGDYATAARFFAESGDHRRAALAYEKLGRLPEAAAEYAKARKTTQAAQMFADYFRQTQDPIDAQVTAAEACLRLLHQETKDAPLAPELRGELLAAVATRFDEARRYDIAAHLFQEAGQLDRAGEVYVRAGKLEEAAKCMRDAGKLREANQIAARFHETHGRWSKAGMAYAGAGDYRKAGDCFAKVNDAQRTAECYEKAGEYYGAALARCHLKQYEQAILLLQRIREADKMFDPSRALLGRCFYEMHDYEHCAATLDNHLTGKRVETTNIDYFYMLALAYEQLGRLEESQRILYKIQSVNVSFKDVAQRLSNICSRISMGAMAEPAAAAAPRPASDPERTQVMEMVEGLLGGRYRLEQELGRGGMGVVYLARDTQLDRPVALKFLGTLMDDSEEYRQRFMREAKVAARVNHPNIISIYDISATLGRAHIVMEYVQGPSLARYIREKGRLGAREAINMFLQACSALDAVHKAGIVHRDIKPDNILIAKGGLVKLTDFGLAKAETSRITAANVIMGTPAYMSPEQSRGVDVDARSDIYSMGLVLHEMLTGKPVFIGADIIERQQHESPARPGALIEGLPEMLDEVVMKCIAKNARDRFQTVSELAETLRKVPVS